MKRKGTAGTKKASSTVNAAEHNQVSLEDTLNVTIATIRGPAGFLLFMQSNSIVLGRSDLPPSPPGSLLVDIDVLKLGKLAALSEEQLRELETIPALLAKIQYSQSQDQFVFFNRGPVDIIVEGVSVKEGTKLTLPARASINICGILLIFESTGGEAAFADSLSLGPLGFLPDIPAELLSVGGTGIEADDFLLS
jgi:hypothetical protein